MNLDGGYTHTNSNIIMNNLSKVKEDREIKDNRKTFNYSNLQCPGPIVNISKEIKNIAIGDQIEVVVTDHGFLNDIKVGSNKLDIHLLDSMILVMKFALLFKRRK